ncbi:MAG: surface-adhesin E family protein [Pseudomonadota bacterium]
MKRLICLLSLLPMLAHASQWAKVASIDGNDSYVDKASLLKVDKNTKAWSMESFSSEQSKDDGTTYRSMKSLKTYSCGERTTTLLSQVYYAEPMGKGAVVQSLKYEKFTPEDIVPDSAEDGALQLICHGKK